MRKEGKKEEKKKTHSSFKYIGLAKKFGFFPLDLMENPKEIFGQSNNKAQVHMQYIDGYTYSVSVTLKIAWRRGAIRKSQKKFSWKRVIVKRKKAGKGCCSTAPLSLPPASAAPLALGASAPHPPLLFPTVRCNQDAALECLSAHYLSFWEAET